MKRKSIFLTKFRGMEAVGCEKPPTYEIVDRLLEAYILQHERYPPCRTDTASRNARDVAIVRFYFGLDGGDAETYRTVGIKFGLCADRVRQIIHKVYRVLASKRYRHIWKEVI